MKYIIYTLSILYVLLKDCVIKVVHMSAESYATKIAIWTMQELQC